MDSDKEAAFRSTWRAVLAADGTPWAHPPVTWPRYEWLQWLVANEPVVLHGSNATSIDTFAPRWQMDYMARFRKGVWATGDGIWPIFFAIVDRSTYQGSMRNGCWWETAPNGARRKCYRFSLNAASLHRGAWTQGTVYVLPRQSFQQVCDADGHPTEEWISERPVRPLCRVTVEPQDFPFLADVQGHEEAPPITPPHWPVAKAAPAQLEAAIGLYALDADLGIDISRVDDHLVLSATKGALHTDLELSVK